MPNVYLYANQILVQSGLVAVSETCCCGYEDPCAVTFALTFIPTPESVAAVGDVLAAQQYGNRAYHQDDFAGTAYWSARCCGSDANDTQQVVVTGAGGQETTLTIPKCVG